MATREPKSKAPKNRVRQFREALNLSQEELAARCRPRLSARSIHLIETRQQRPREETQRRIAEALRRGEGEVFPSRTASQKTPPDDRPIWEVLMELGNQIPLEEWEKLPTDLSINIDHYLYGAPKKRLE